jgi:UDP:flavonoid glycosyltransferase YjiC (YdhE family)
LVDIISRVRVIATFVGGWGHAEPLIPIVDMAVAHGHSVMFAGQEAVVPRLEALGFATRVVGPDTLTSARAPLLAPDREAERSVMRDHFFTAFGTFRATALRSMFESQRPDLVICDEVDVGAVVAAETASVPCVTVNVIAAGLLNSALVIGEAWNELRASNALDPDPNLDRLAGTLMVAAIPRSFRHPAASSPPRLRFVRPAILARPASPRSTSRPLVYVTLGTVFNVESGDLFNRIIRAMSSVDADVVVTTGSQIDPAEFTEVPTNVVVERFRPQAEILPACSAVVTHGGSGTLLAALALGVPAAVLPMGADQLDNADRVDELGVGFVLDPLTAGSTEVAAAVMTLINDDSYRHHAASLATEAASQQPLESLPELVALLHP